MNFCFSRKMDLLKLLIGSSKAVDPCFLCFKNNSNNFDIHTVFEIRNSCDVISLSLADMLKILFPIGDFIFMQVCNDCSDLISELYILIHNRNSKILLLDSFVKQLSIKTKTSCSLPLTNNKMILNLQVTSCQELNDIDLITNDVDDKHSRVLNYTSNEDKSYKRTNLNPISQIVKKCQYCSEIFAQTDELISHLKTHRKKRRKKHTYHYCKDCNYKTLCKSTLEAHINKNHLGTRPHICQICHKGFYSKSNLNEHVRTHNSQRHHVCELCGSSFIHKKSLVEHLRLHSDTRPYKCDICEKSFVTSGRRSDHVKRSHMEKNECCMICNKKYSLKKELNRHMNNVHLIQ